MSAQTGRPTVHPAPPSSRRIDRARLRIQQLRDDPNPVWMRELRQAARLQRTPIILAVVTSMMTLLICSIGGIASVAGEPAKVGVALFHTFFSVAFFVVTWAGPAVAASTIAAERSGGTWEALVLTGLGPQAIARGKFLASVTYISLYIVMLAPVGVLPFLFGGVTASEVGIAFLLLGLFGVLSVAFGLSISSKLSSAVAAVMVTLFVAVPFSTVLYVSLGPALSVAVHDLWPGVPEGYPVWLPTAYIRADFGLEYVTLLVLAPLAAIVLPAWFLYEVTVANMAGLSDDRSSGIRRWFLVATPVLTLVTLAPGFASRDWHWVVAGASIELLFLIFAAYVFAGEPLGPSRRVRVHWQRGDAGPFERYLGPGIMRAVSLLVVLGAGALAVETAAGALLILGGSGTSARTDAERIACFGGYGLAFFVFVAGFVSWTRARSTTPSVPRLLLTGVLFLANIGPWIAMAIGGVLTERGRGSDVLAAPSPFYAFYMMKALDEPASSRDPVLMAGAVCAAGWALVGLGLLGLAGARTKKVVREHHAVLERVDQMLREEDEAKQASTPAALPEPAAGEPEAAR